MDTAIREGQPVGKYIEVPSGEPTPPGAKEVKIIDPHDDSGTHQRDVTGISGVGNMADGARLVSQFGLLAVFSAFILTICGGLLWFGRQDLLSSVEKTNSMHLEMFKNLRDDQREERQRTDTHQSKMWMQLRELTTATQEGNRSLRNATDIMEENHKVFLKILDEQKKTTKAVGEKSNQ
jgi:hypothetical protein